ncbi:ABC transporter substrate-binding protein [Pseudomonas gingeri]|uniref:ABC transporter substrate-binding protein n=1 Tax=Pseudomonas gingeri TaxID=117681 RepID=UPI0015A4383A|nr:ABC transporter substrate-binding protein [Pseudomonas gingeri]NWE48546.1 ABC transporter substrate-binding protein [Pseudomonas gingeri]
MNKTLILAGALSAALMGTAHAENLLKVALNADIRSTEPGVNRDTNSDAIILHITEGLVAFREDATVGPLLAKDVQMSDDGLRYTFHLRDGVKFQNGAPLTSAEVLWTWKHYLDPKTQWRCAPEFDGHGGAKIVDISAPDALTVVFTLDKPNGLFLTSTALPECGGSGILHPDSVVDGQWKAPIGTGPFRLGEWKPGQYVELLRNANYTPRDEKAPDGYTGNKTTSLDRVRLLVIPDPAAAKAALLSKNVDLLIDVTPLDATELAASSGIKVTSSGTMSVNALLFQTRDPLLKDVRLRQAIAHALDSAQIVAALTGGRSQANNSMVASGSHYHKAAQDLGFNFDPAKTAQLLREAGYKGEPIKLIVNKRYAAIFDMGVFVQAMAKASGINLELETLEWGTQLERYQTGNYQMMAFPYSERLDPALSFDSVTGDKDKEPRKVWDNPEARQWLREAQRESDIDKRQALFDQLHRQMLKDVPMIPMYNGNAIAASRDYVQGLRTWPVSKPRLWTVSVPASGSN